MNWQKIGIAAATSAGEEGASLWKALDGKCIETDNVVELRKTLSNENEVLDQRLLEVLGIDAS